MPWCLGKHTYYFKRYILKRQLAVFEYLQIFLYNKNATNVAQKCQVSNIISPIFLARATNALASALRESKPEISAEVPGGAAQRFGGSSMCYFLQGLMSVGVFWWCFEFQCLKSSCQHIHINHVHWIQGFQMFPMICEGP